MAKKAQNKAKHYLNDRPIEAWKDVPSQVTQSLIDDLGKSGVTNLWEQLLGTGSFEKKQQQKAAGDLAQGEELDLKSLKSKQEAKTPSYVEPGIDYRREVLHGERRITQENNQAIQMQIQEIVVELKRLTASSKILQAEFKEVTASQRIEKPGKYHLTFFEWVLSVVRSARLRVEDAGSWLSTMKSKKAQRQYWAMFKKHGTSFGLSNERVVATQTG